jgi:HEAT repeat protein
MLRSPRVPGRKFRTMSNSRAWAAMILGVCLFAVGCGNSTDQLIAQLGDRDPAVRRTAARTLKVHAGDADRVIPALTTAVKDEDPEVRKLAISAIGERGAAAQPAVPKLERALGDPEVAVRESAALAIYRIDPGRESYEPVILESLSAGHGTMFLSVGRMGVSASWAVPTLVKLIAHRQPSVRALAARTLGEIGVGSSEVKAALARASQDSEPLVRSAADKALQQVTAQRNGL